MHTLRQVLANHTLQMVQGNYILLILLKLYLFTSSVFDWNFYFVSIWLVFQLLWIHLTSWFISDLSITGHHREIFYWHSCHINLFQGSLQESWWIVARWRAKRRTYAFARSMEEVWGLQLINDLIYFSDLSKCFNKTFLFSNKHLTGNAYYFICIPTCWR